MYVSRKVPRENLTTFPHSALDLLKIAELYVFPGKTSKSGVMELGIFCYFSPSAEKSNLVNVALLTPLKYATSWCIAIRMTLLLKYCIDPLSVRNKTKVERV